MFGNQERIVALSAIRGNLTRSLLATGAVLIVFVGKLGAQQFLSQADVEQRPIPAPGFTQSVPSGQIEQTSPAPSSEELIDLELSNTPMEQALQLFRAESNLIVVASEKAKNLRITASIRGKPEIRALKELARQNNAFVEYDREANVYTIYAAEERARDSWDTESVKRFEREINDAFPDSIVRLSVVGKQLLVRGQAHDVVEASRIIQLIDAEARTKKEIRPQGEDSRTTTQINQSGGPFGSLSFLQTTEPDLTVIDMLTVTGEQQVSLRVTVAEVDRNAARQIGLNFGFKDGSSVFQSVFVSPNPAEVGASPNPAEVGAAVITGGNLPVSLDSGQIQLAINALRQMSLSKTLAEPTLTALNGQKASFQAGGQFPIPIVSGQTVGGLQGVSFVPFGVTLEFTPYITDRDRIRLNVLAEVSNRSQNATAIGGSADSGGTLVPGLDLRKFQTIVELREGQTLAVAGLISNNQNNQSDRVPFFGDLPVVGRLGALDRISAREQELVILVTPELVRPLSPEQLPPLPGTDIFEPGDIEFYLGAHMEGTRNEDFRSPVRTDIHRQHSFYNHRDVFIVGPHGYTECGPQPGVFK